MKDKLELLAPAGDLQKLKYALAFGADAVYAGIPRFSLRTKEIEFTQQTILDGINFCRQHNKKIYLTLNIFPHNRKLDSFREILSWMEDIKPDGIIVSDPGIIMLSKELCPSVPLHLSTQANTVNWASVKFWQELGVSRIILSRELSLNEISEIRQKVPDIELEIFVHGAICVAYSGRCLLSNYFLHRDPNQGTCGHSCRWDYKIYHESDFTESVQKTEMKGQYFLEESERPNRLLPINEDEHGTYIMNSRDLCAIHLLDKIRSIGVDSVKIEGRNKSVYYVSIITRAYREALNNVYADQPFDTKHEDEMFTVANRGYITGFLEKNPRQFGENIKSSHSGNQTRRFIAVAIGRSQLPGEIKVKVRNRFQIGDEIEAVSPEETRKFLIRSIRSEDGEILDVAHGGGQDVYIDIPFAIEPYTLFRKFITVQQNNSNILKVKGVEEAE